MTHMSPVSSNYQQPRICWPKIDYVLKMRNEKKSKKKKTRERKTRNEREMRHRHAVQHQSITTVTK